MNGDLSGDRSNPSSIALLPGNNTLTAITGSGDLEYVRVNVPPGTTLDSLFLRTYSGLDGIAFIGAQRGSTFTESNTSPNVANLLGYTHFGPGAGNVGANILPAIGRGFGAQGFTPPLGSGNYTFWMQQLGSPTTYQLDYVVTPEPASVAVLAVGAAAMMAKRRRG